MRRWFVWLEEHRQRERRRLTLNETYFHPAFSVACFVGNPRRGRSPVFANGDVPGQHVIAALRTQNADNLEA